MAHSLQLVTFADEAGGDGEPVFYHDHLRKVLQSVLNMPVLVVSITGVFRSGKSFLLNLLVTYLKHMSQNSRTPWKSTNMEIDGFHWARSAETVTHGIWISQDPFIIQTKTGKVAVLLVDCQGTGDVNLSSTHLDTIIFYISLQLSSVQLINLKTQMTSDDITRIQLCNGYAETAGAASAIFDRLFYVIRDWNHDDSLGERPDYFREMLNTTQSSEARQAGEGVLKAFSKVSTFMLPEPSGAVKKASERSALSVNGADLGEDFLDAIADLFAAIFHDVSRLNLRSGRELVDDFVSLEERIRRCDVKALSPAEGLDDARAFNAFSQTRSQLQQAFSEDCPTLIQLIERGERTPEDVMNVLTRLWGVVEEGYTQVYGGSDQSRNDSDAFKKYGSLLKEVFDGFAELERGKAQEAVLRRQVALAADEAERLRVQQLLHEQQVRNANMQEEISKKWWFKLAGSIAVGILAVIAAPEIGAGAAAAGALTALTNMLT